MSNLVSLGLSNKNQAMQGFKQVADMEQSRDQANKNLQAQFRGQRTSNTAMGAGLGWMAGSKMLGAKLGSVAGPLGALGGAALGYLATELF